MANFGKEGDFAAAATFEELASVLKPPRAVLVMVKAGPPVDETIDARAKVLDRGDTIIDGGNSFFQDTQRRAAAVEKMGLGYIGCGVSGGEEGALHGPSLMPGGTRESYTHVEGMLTAIAATVDGVPCCTYIGPDGAGHFVKMVHNGIEYADIQLIAESYDLLRSALGITPDELASIFRDWNNGRLQSYLIEITSYVLAKHDGGTGKSLVDAIEDEAEQKGTGRWTSQSALELGGPLTGITEAVFARTLSSQKARRAQASGVLARLAGGKAAVDHGIAIPAFASSLAYYDGYRRARGPANLIQGLRDYFGSHTYHRVDREGAYHTRWAQDGSEVRVD